MLHGAMPAETCFAVPLHTSFSQKFQRVTAALVLFGASYILGTQAGLCSSPVAPGNLLFPLDDQEISF